MRSSMPAYVLTSLRVVTFLVALMTAIIFLAQGIGPGASLLLSIAALTAMAALW